MTAKPVLFLLAALGGRALGAFAVVGGLGLAWLLANQRLSPKNR